MAYQLRVVLVVARHHTPVAESLLLQRELDWPAAPGPPGWAVGLFVHRRAWAIEDGERRRCKSSSSEG